MIGDMLGALVLTMAAATQIGVDAQHGGRDATSARCVLPRLPRHTLVDREVSATRLAVRLSRRSQGAYRAGTAPAYAPEKPRYPTLRSARRARRRR